MPSILAILTDRRRHPRATGRRGGTATGLIVTLSVIGALTVAAIVMTPASLDAANATQDEGSCARDPAHQRTIDLLGALVSRSRELLALHQRGPTPFLELVLWLEDVENPGRVDPPEVAVLAHSEILQTITFFELAESDQRDEPIDAELLALAGAVPAESVLPAADVASPEFCVQWRRMSGVAPRVVATGVAGMHAEIAGESENGRTLLRIALTWAGDSSDSPDEASRLLDVVMRPDGAG